MSGAASGGRALCGRFLGIRRTIAGLKVPPPICWRALRESNPCFRRERRVTRTFTNGDERGRTLISQLLGTPECGRILDRPLPSVGENLEKRSWPALLVIGIWSP